MSHMIDAKMEMDSDKTDCEEFDSKWGGEVIFLGDRVGE